MKGYECTVACGVANLVEKVTPNKKAKEMIEEH
jgi:hypothetical protein